MNACSLASLLTTAIKFDNHDGDVVDVAICLFPLCARFLHQRLRRFARLVQVLKRSSECLGGAEHIPDPVRCNDNKLVLWLQVVLDLRWAGQGKSGDRDG